MEREGVEVRKEELKAYGDALIARIEELEKSIHTQAGVEFNINSPKQLGEILFEKLELPGGVRTPPYIGVIVICFTEPGGHPPERSCRRSFRP